MYIYITTRSARLKLCHIYVRPITSVFFLASLFIFSVFFLHFIFFHFSFNRPTLFAYVIFCCFSRLLHVFFIFLQIFFFRSLFCMFLFSFSISTLNCHPEIYAQRSHLMSTFKLFSLNFCVCLSSACVPHILSLSFIMSLTIFEEQYKL